jgi:hypothetical protein
MCRVKLPALVKEVLQWGQLKSLSPVELWSVSQALIVFKRTSHSEQLNSFNLCELSCEH